MKTPPKRMKKKKEKKNEEKPNLFKRIFLFFKENKFLLKANFLARRRNKTLHLKRDDMYLLSVIILDFIFMLFTFIEP